MRYFINTIKVILPSSHHKILIIVSPSANHLGIRTAGHEAILTIYRCCPAGFPPNLAARIYFDLFLMTT